MHVTAREDWKTVSPVEQSSIFLGYETLKAETEIVKYAEKEGEIHIVLEKTPFYAESGGQLGDRGIIVGKDLELQVIDTQKEGDEIIHICVPKKFDKIRSAKIIADVDEKWRYPTMRNHTATHLLHAALRRILGDHVQQAGSLVAPDRLRFDFTHFKKIKREELEEIEWLVNEKIQEDLSVKVVQTKFRKAKEMGAMALFGEKYGDEVRMIVIDDFSKELCGGTHVNQTGQIGPFVITQESSIASGIRRIEALTGPKAVEFIQKSRDALFDLEQMLNAPQPDELPGRVREMIEEMRKLEKEMQRLQASRILERVDEYLKKGQQVGTIRLVVEHFRNLEIDLLKQLGDRLRQKATRTVGFFINHQDDRLNFVCVVTDDLIKQKGVKAGDLVREAAKIAGGGGGGRPHLATAGAKDSTKLEEVITFLKEKLRQV